MHCITHIFISVFRKKHLILSLLKTLAQLGAIKFYLNFECGNMISDAELVIDV